MWHISFPPFSNYTCGLDTLRASPNPWPPRLDSLELLMESSGFLRSSHIMHSSGMHQLAYYLVSLAQLHKLGRLQHHLCLDSTTPFPLDFFTRMVNVDDRLHPNVSFPRTPRFSTPALLKRSTMSPAPTEKNMRQHILKCKVSLNGLASPFRYIAL